MIKRTLGSVSKKTDINKEYCQLQGKIHGQTASGYKKIFNEHTKAISKTSGRTFYVKKWYFPSTVKNKRGKNRID